MKSSKKQINENPAAIVSAVAKYGPMIMQIVDIIEKNPELISGIKDLMGLKEGANTKMKISKRQLRRIIREEVETLEYEMLQDTTDELLDAGHPEDVVAQRDSWAGGQNVHNQIDHGEASGGGPNTRGQEIMRVTESQLRKIIRHEKKKILESFGGTSARTGESFVDMAVNALLAGDYKSATEAVLNGYMMDDTWVSEEEALENTLMGIREEDITPEEVQAAAEWWYTQYKDGMHAPQGQDEEREDWARAKAWANR